MPSKTRGAPRKSVAGSQPVASTPARPALPDVVDRIANMQAAAMSLRAQGKTIGFVPTMGALHDGHVALMREARQRADVVVTSIFVNPLQFGPSEDYARYPRDLDADRRLCAAAGVDVVFAPSASDMYPAGFDTKITAGGLGRLLEGAVRPGHFDGVLTVVAMLFHVVQPHFAVFGEKDFQQLALVKKLVRDLRMPIEIVPMPVIRDVDGLALSSRNAYLAPGERRGATVLSRALVATQDAAQSGERDGFRLTASARAVLDLEPSFSTEYVALVDPTTLTAVDALGERPARLLIAGRLGKVRLIDNGPVFPIAWRR
jgi:pantoate--beta-alanine ligase